MALIKSTDSAAKPRLAMRNGVWTVSHPPCPYDCADKAKRLMPIRWHEAYEYVHAKNQERRNG